VNRIRVLIANHPRLMRELISTTMADQPDIELVGEVGKQQDLAEAVAETRPDVLTISMGDQREYRVLCGFLLGRYPEIKIIALAPEQNRALLYWAVIDIRSKSLESSEDGILNAMRQGPQVVGLARI
jgi:DNA-binding NarL/FixJ family response regulator